MKTPLHLLLLLTLPLLVMSSCHPAGGSAENVGNEGVQNQTIVTRDQFVTGEMVIGNMEKVRFEHVIRLNGSVTVPPGNKAKVSIMMPGFVKQISMLEGEYIREGQTLLILENIDYIQLQQDYLEAYHSLDYLKSEYERQRSMIDENITSQKNYLSAESEYEKILAVCAGMEEKLRLLNLDPAQVSQGNIVSEVRISAPITGYITRQDATLGMYLEPQEVVIEMVDNSDLQLKLTAFEKDVASIVPGQAIRYRNADALSDWHTGEVRVVGKSVDPDTKTILVYGRMKAEDKRAFMEGMYIEAEIITRGAESYGLPNEAVQREEDKYFVFVKTAEEGDNLIFEKRYVETGQVTEDSTEILSETGLDDVLIRGAFNLAIE